MPLSPNPGWFLSVFEESKTDVYRLRIKTNRDGSGVVKWARCTKEVMTIDKRYEAAVLNFLISNLLLGQEQPFPRHIKLEESAPGEYQGMVAGTDFEETIVDKRILKRLYK